MSWFDDMFEHTIDYALPSGVTNHGDTSFAVVVVNAPALVQQDAKLIRTSDGEEIMGTHIISTAAPLVIGARVWVDGETNPRIVHVVKNASMDGDTLYEVRVA